MRVNCQRVAEEVIEIRPVRTTCSRVGGGECSEVPGNFRGDGNSISQWRCSWYIQLAQFMELYT